MNRHSLLSRTRLTAFLLIAIPSMAILAPPPGAPSAAGHPQAALTGISAASPWTTDGTQDYAHLGAAVATAGDVNGDGISDFLVCVPDFDSTGTDEGRVYLYLGTPGGPAATPSWIGADRVAHSHFGFSAGPAGDVNGDGYDDVAIGATRTTPGTPYVNPGYVFVYLGSATGLETTPSWSYTSGQAGDRLGYSVCTAGDVNGDGIADLLAGAPRYDNGSGVRGRVFLFHGTPSGLSSGPVWTYDGETVGSELGYSVSTAGDVDADGLSDFVVGAPGFESAVAPGGGRAYLFTGAAPTPVKNAWVTAGGSAGARHGSSVATAGDMNGDGHADAVVGAPDYTIPGGPTTGRAVVYPGSATGLLTTGILTLYGGGAGEKLGASVGPAGDLDGDGYGDIAVGSPGYSAPPIIGVGRVQVFLGNNATLDDLPAWSVNGTEMGAELGHWVCTAGDANGDGFGDLAVGEWLRDAGGTDRGRAYVYWGSAQSLVDDPFWAVAGQSEEKLGYSGAAAGDINGDGFSDFLVGAPTYYTPELGSSGRVRVFLGSEGGPVASPTNVLYGEHPDGFFGYSLGSAGDVNGDGYGDVIIGQPESNLDPGTTGRAFVYLGSSTGALLPNPWVTTVGSEHARVGWTVSSAGDIDGDGFGDVVIGAPWQEAGAETTGAAFVYYGSPSGLGATPDTLLGAYPHASFGHGLSSLDINGDGYSDVLVGSPVYSSFAYAQEGRVDVFYGSPAGISLTPAQSFVVGGGENAWLGYVVAGVGPPGDNICEAMLLGSPQYSEAFPTEGRALYFDAGPCPGLLGSVTINPHQGGAQTGRALGAAGDVNGDGRSDVVVGAPFYTQSQTREGGAWLYVGLPDALPNTWDWRMFGGQSGAYLGWTVTGIGDINGDGFDDVLVGTPYYDVGAGFSHGKAEVFAGGGRVSPDHNKIFRPQIKRAAGGPLARLDLADEPDRIRLDMRARSAAGRAHVRLEWNLAAYGTVPGGTPQRGAWAITGSPGPYGSSLDTYAIATGLSPSTDYAVRFRAAARQMPFFPFTRWFTTPLTVWAQKQFRTPASGVDVGPGPLAGMPGGPRVTAVYPNPLRSRTTVSFVLPSAGHVALRVFDTRGRLVATLVDRDLAAGVHSATWDGRDSRGVRAGAGIYYVHLDCEGGADGRKLVILR